MKKLIPAEPPEWDAAIDAIVKDDLRSFTQLLKKNPELAQAGSVQEFFIKPIARQIYKGDTLLHVAAAGYRVEISGLLLKNGARVNAANRRGAQPLHYAAVGARDAKQQEKILALLVRAGANPDARDKGGVTPLHRAVRTRSSVAVKQLLKLGASLRSKNEELGSTPLHLAVQTTGASGSGSKQARVEQMEIIRILLAAGAKPSDKNKAGKTVLASTKDKECLKLLV